MTKHDGPHLAALNYGISLHQAGDLDGAVKVYRNILRQVPRESNALRLLGAVELQRHNLDDAEKHLARALKVYSGSADTHYFMGRVFWAKKRSERAFFHLNKCIELDPRHVPALVSLGCALQETGNPDTAVELFERALSINPNAAEAWHNLGYAQHRLGQLERALACYDRSIQTFPRSPDTHAARGHVLSELQHYGEALACYERVLAIKPDFAEAQRWRGNMLFELRRYDEAVAAYDRALALAPGLATAVGARATALMQMKRYAEAASGFAQALAAAPELEYTLGNLVMTKMHCCNWEDLENLSRQLVDAVGAGQRATTPFILIGVPGSDQVQLIGARTWIADKAPARVLSSAMAPRGADGRLRIAYVSSDFHDHPVAHLIAGLFEQHDRSRFETIGVSLGPNQDSAMRQRITKSFDRLEHVRSMNDTAVATLMREAGVDIAIDLNGLTQGMRTGIFALRPAPVQVNYLGYPGTMGTDYIDYIIADRWVIPDDRHAAYGEKIVTLPDSYQPNDSRRPIADNTPTRAETGLPESGFVFCSFNNNFKILPAIFDVWMGLLREVEGSVLWLYEGNAAASENLRIAARERGIAPERLVFAPRVPADAHLARHRRADLFLDTLPYNAHTTASDALWAGLPVLTCVGSTFAGRVAASLLDAVGLPDLITHSLEDYQALALRLARDPAALTALKSRLALNRLSAPLFNTSRYCRHLEAAYVEMWERHQRGEAPASFAVAAID